MSREQLNTYKFDNIYAFYKNKKNLIFLALY